MYTSLLGWERRRYLWWALVLVVLSVGLYLSQSPDAPQPRNGGTWQGYVLGTVGALLIVWLSLLGVRKRRYRSAMGTVEGWTSAHVYLGLALIVVATLHCAVQFGWNIHTLAYVLVCAVVLSGIFGLYAYLHIPRHMSTNRAGVSREGWLDQLVESEREIRELSRRCDADVQGMVVSSVEMTGFAASLRDALTARDRSRLVLPDGQTVSNRGQERLLAELSRRVPDARKQAEAEVLSDMLALCGRRQVILARLRRDTRLQLLLRCWLWLHIPLTMALLAALSIHVLSVFIYW